jgi:hypothetical protein
MSQVINEAAAPARVEHSTLALQGAQAANEAQWRRRLTVEIRVEAEAGDDSPLSGLVVEALREYIDMPGGQAEASGMFESKGGLDVHWRALNRYFQGDALIGEQGVNDRGERVDSLLAGMVQPEPSQRVPVPMAIAQMEGEFIVIEGVRYSMCVFQKLANPDPAKRYVFTRIGDVVNVVERA